MYNITQHTARLCYCKLGNALAKILSKELLSAAVINMTLHVHCVSSAWCQLPDPTKNCPPAKSSPWRGQQPPKPHSPKKLQHSSTARAQHNVVRRARIRYAKSARANCLTQRNALTWTAPAHQSTSTPSSHSSWRRSRSSSTRSSST